MTKKLGRKAMGASALLLAASTLGLSAPAQAITINLIDIGGVTGSQAELGFKIAAAYWSSVLAGDAVINLEVGFSNLGSGILGGTSTELETYVPISDYYSLLQSSATSTVDATAVANLPTLSSTGSLAFAVPGYSNSTTQTGVNNNAASRISPDGEAISNTIAISSANYKALTGGSTTSIDATIQFSSTFAFDFDPTNGISSGTYDFIGVAVHEIGHALGFLSGQDDFDYSQGSGFPVDDYWWAYALDIFRYSEDGQLSMVPGVESYFSIDGGATSVGSLSTGENYGDGWQASHWKAPGGCTNFIGIMNPYICSALVDSVTAEDLTVLDAIGWTLSADAMNNSSYVKTTAQMYADYFASQTAVPELSTWAQMVLGFGVFGAVLRRSKAKVRTTFA